METALSDYLAWMEILRAQ